MVLQGGAYSEHCASQYHDGSDGQGGGIEPRKRERKQQELEAIELQITATNVSTRTIYFLSNYWTATGSVVKARPEDDGWLESINQQSANGQANDALIGRHYELSNRLLIAWANIFPAEYFLVSE
jgi:hypothetical protein